MATTITANGINFPDGSASAPSIGGTDTNTGLFTGSDIVGFATGGLERIRIDSSGRVIIGDDHTNNAFAGGDSLIIGNEDNGTRSGITLVSASNTDGGLYFSHGSSNTAQGQVVYHHANNYMAFYVNGNKRALDILSSGDVCIGRNSQLSNAKVSIQCDAAEAGIAVQLNSSSGTSNLIQAYSSAGPNVASIRVNPDATPDLLFELHDGSNTVERLRITSDGQVLVNSTSVVKSHDALTVKRAAGNHSATSLTVDATTATGSYANALIFTKAKDYYYNGLVFESSSGHQGGVVGKMTAASGTTPQIELRIGGTSLNQSDKAALTIYPSGNVSLPDGNLEVASGHGIDFSAQTASSASGVTNDGELLDHYERGTWNPGFQTSNGNWSGGVNVSNGNFVRVGKLVYIFGRVSWSSTGGTGNMQIINLPFSIANGSDYDGQLSIGYREGVSYPRVHTSLSTSANRINLHYVDSNSPYNSGSIVIGALQSSGHIYFAGCYTAY